MTLLTAPAPTPAWSMYRAVVGVGLACGLLIVTVFELTAPIIRENLVAARQRAVLDVLPGALTSAAFRRDGDRFVSTADDSAEPDLVFAGYDPGGTLVGVALEARGMGYQDVVRVLYGYSFELQAVVGMRVLESRETPGLGDRVETDEAYLRNFERLDVALAEDGTAPRNPIRAVRSGTKTNAWEIDCITGATITSTAIADMLRDSTAAWIPVVAARRADFARDGR